MADSEIFLVAHQMKEIYWGGMKFIATGYSGSIFISLDGIDWEFQSFEDFSINSVLSNGLQYVAVGDEGAIFSSNDGFNWTGS